VAIARLGVLLYTLLKNGTVYEARRFRQEKLDAKALAACSTCRFLRHFVPQKPRFIGCFGNCKVKNRLFGDFFMLIARSATNS
jgi:hypothetical protein